MPSIQSEKINLFKSLQLKIFPKRLICQAILLVAKAQDKYLERRINKEPVKMFLSQLVYRIIMYCDLVTLINFKSCFEC